MTAFPLGFGLDQVVGNIALDVLSSLALIRPRIIGPFIANVTVEELHRDELIITEHPVEQNAAITDHAYKKPSSIIIRAGWSNSSEQALGNPNYVQEIYQLFLVLQASRQPFDVITGKRFYTNMLMQSLSVRTDEKTENALDMVVECREVILVTTQTSQLASPANMAAPQTTSPTTDTGAATVIPAPNFNASAVPLQ